MHFDAHFQQLAAIFACLLKFTHSGLFFQVYHELDSLGELDNTYIFYTSDHGYHLGQFGLVKGKAFPFDVDTKVPFLVRGPNIKSGSLFQQPVLNIDLAPTFLDIGGIAIPEHMDGKSIAPLFHESEDLTVDPAPSWRQAFLIERGKMTEDRYAKIAHTMPSFNQSRNETSEFRKLTKQEILAAECVKPKFQDPCLPYQRRKCIKKKNGNWKMISCHNHLRSLLNIRDDPQDCDCAEKRLQRKFIDRHASRKLRHNKFVLRSKRDIEDFNVLESIADEEIDEVDVIMEDLSDEINDLQLSINDTMPDEDDYGSMPCSVNEHNEIACDDIVYKDKKSWRDSRLKVNEQIRQLRAQMNELKEIRSHLKAKRPAIQHHQPDLDTDLLEIEEELSVQNHHRENKACQCHRNRALLRSLRRNRRRQIKLARRKRRLLRKQEKAAKVIKSKKKLEDSECSPDERLNCFSHNNDHWKTAPFWTDGSFCACTNSNTNTYSCVRNVNETHNYLYCEFVSGLITYYNLNVDPYQLRNIYSTLTTEELNFMHHQLAVLKNRGMKYSVMYSSVARQRSFIKRYGNLQDYFSKDMFFLKS